jgi:hypothetical protein
MQSRGKNDRRTTLKNQFKSTGEFGFQKVGKKFSQVATYDICCCDLGP